MPETTGPLGNPRQCGCCFTTIGNIAGDLNRQDLTLYGYLCTNCRKIIDLAGTDLLRLQQAVVYSKKTRK